MVKFYLIKNIFTLIFAIVFCSTVISLEPLLFYSNIGENSILVEEVTELEGEKVSLGYNLTKLTSIISRNGFQILGDMDVDWIHVDGRMAFTIGRQDDEFIIPKFN